MTILLTCQPQDYGRFFNDQTEWCNKEIMWKPAWWMGLRTPYLTQALRKRSNDGVLALNSAIAKAVTTVNEELKATPGNQKLIRVIDTDHVYEHHRWCDGATQPPNFRDNAWFFNLGAPDITSLLAEVGPSASDPTFDIRTINTTTCNTPNFDMPDVAGGGLFCDIAKAYQTNSSFQLLGDDGNGNNVTLNPATADRTSYLKAFHPKTLPNEKIAELIWQAFLHDGTRHR